MMMSDKITVYPIVRKTEWFYKDFDINPNSVTLFNNIVITPILLYYLYYDYYLLSLVLVWIRAYFDGVDGYIARKFGKCSKQGEIYDHFSDCLYTGALTAILMSKVPILLPYSYSTGYINAMFSLVIDYGGHTNLKFIADLAGLGGNEDGYSFAIPVGFVAFTWFLSLSGLID